jgi:hypothetical protein
MPANFISENSAQGKEQKSQLLWSQQGFLSKGIDKKTVKRKGIEPIKRVFTYVLYPATHFL